MTSLPSPDARQSPETKTAQQRGEDIAYTMNHAIACTATDVIGIPISTLTGKWLGWNVHIGCSHDHAGSWWRQAVGEAVGDVGAVPLTLALQHYAPNLMNGIGHAMAVPLSPIYHLGAEHSTARWAKQNGVDSYSEEYRNRVEATYRHEIEHIQLGGVWSILAAAGNIATQKCIGEAPWWQLGLAKLAGSSASVLGLFVARAAAPETAHDWDHWTSRHVFVPMTKLLGAPFGADTSGLDAAAEHESTSERWQEKLTPEKTPTPAGRGA